MEQLDEKLRQPVESYPAVDSRASQKQRLSLLARGGAGSEHLRPDLAASDDHRVRLGDEAGHLGGAYISSVPDRRLRTEGEGDDTADEVGVVFAGAVLLADDGEHGLFSGHGDRLHTAFGISSSDGSSMQ